jgi:23S rRNA (cytosine1962-C5)-methyltransferase
VLSGSSLDAFSPGSSLEKTKSANLRVSYLAIQPRICRQSPRSDISSLGSAAYVGATTLNVDLSKKSLARGRENFALNSLTTADHRFIADDVMAVLPRLARQGEKFDAIILDPPTFSRSPGGKAFQVGNDFEKLLVDALDLAERNSHVLLSTNCSTLREHALEVMARYGLKAGRRTATFHRQPPLPDFPPGTGASSIWLTLR